MGISELARELGVSADLLRYLEHKGFVEPSRRILKKREVRDYSDEQVDFVKLIAKYIRQGFKHDIAYQKAKDEGQNPRLV